MPTWCKVLHVNLTAPFILTQVLLPLLRESEDACIIFVSSGVVHNSRPFWGAYAVAKTGLESVRSMLAQDSKANPSAHQQHQPRTHAHPDARGRLSGGRSNSLPAPVAVTGPFLYLLSAQGRGVDGQYFDAQS